MKKILIIEDDPMMREVTQEILDIEGYSTMTAENGWIGLQMVEQYQPDLIICDVMMPQLDGYRLIKQLRQNLVYRTIPFIFLTGKIDRCDLRQAMELGADDYLTKPFEADELVKAVKTQFQKRQIFAQQYLEKIAKIENEFIYLARHDTLTGLPNKLFIEEHFNKNRISVYKHNQVLQLLLIDVDILHRDKLFFGADFKDLLIEIVSQKIQNIILNNEYIDIFGYLKTNQLVILLKPDQDENIKNKNAENIAQQILDQLSQPLYINNNSVFLETNIGIAGYPHDEMKFSELLTCAEFAIEHCHTEDNKNYHFYNQEILNGFFRKVILETDFRYAIERNEFQIYYQPQINIKTGELAGVEALIRWQHPQYCMISPDEFIPIAEDSGFIITLGEWIIKTACNQIKNLQNELGINFILSVNVSAHQLKISNFSNMITDTTQQTKFSPEMLELELTETLFIQDIESVRQTFNQLSKQGVKISIDDFGTGYSSFKYLQEFPFHNLKIDRYFITNIDHLENKQALLKSIIQTADNLHLNIIAEGVETKAELEWLKANNCDIVQGYFFSPPLPLEKLKKFLYDRKSNYC
ncbi:MAG: EAL domain-containing response regulator [Nostocales cyanobacterium]|nr:MAG: EAL domain-containing response regulator [Nostocales cyanobacterium]TAF18137.1 MAG: EAL domain-containing response regulator [Nostocales cyanobacterium]